ncbi:type II secretion system minor pseudopilin GspH [Paraglaciecola psychrophila]|uniref:Type II secretion system protein H n=1 Tax=Paraglaciecola psychrophila 170 TaxID=1129794 RepID=K6Z4M4_9ALTE|nr:type II secretion system minor pseudopilin GspH [Paraglaciecola psychrophila]AGH47577.1 general secretion pathway protein H [Paraglaciecola psychrophila 170]GAC40034.1 general secretion pathway protein H [Paraglaciecola psychrophila 170]
MTMRRSPFAKHAGFTLLEVMLVLLIMGLATGAVVLSYSGENGPDLLKKQTQRLQVVFNMASDFAVLNQRQLGLRVENAKNSYYFMYQDEEQEWQKLELDNTFAEHQLPDLFSLELFLTGLPWETENSLFSSGLFDEELSVSNDGVEIGNEGEKKLDPPQIFIFSSGEITPFSITLAYEPEFSNELPTYYRVNGQDSTPLTTEGPLDAP